MIHLPDKCEKAILGALMARDLKTRSLRDFPM